MIGLIISTLFHARRERERKLNCTRGISKRQSRERQITSMLATIAILFILLKVPYTLCYYLAFEWNLSWKLWVKSSLSGISVAKKITGALSNLNYSINIVVYLTFARSFREKLFKMCRCRKKLVRESYKHTSVESFKLHSGPKYSDKD